MFVACLVLAVLFIALYAGCALFLLRTIRHAVLDTCSLLRLAACLRRGVFIEKNFVELYPVSRNEDFADKVYFLPHNIFLNLIGLFPAAKRLRYAQLCNFLFFFLYLVLLFLVQQKAALLLGVSPRSSLAAALLFSAAVAARARLLLVAALAWSDILNYFLLAAAAFVLLLLQTRPAFPLFIVFGLLCGLAFRNKFQDILLALAGFPLLLTLAADVMQVAAAVVAFLLVTADWFYAEFSRNGKGYRTLYAYMEMFGPFKRKSAASSEQRSSFFLQEFLSGLGMLFSPTRPDSLWRSAGVFIPLTAIALAFFLFLPRLLVVHVFLLVHLLLTLVALSVMRHSVTIDNRTEKRAYGAGKQSHFLFFPMAALSSLSFSLALDRGNGAVFFAIFALLVLSLLHQTYRCLDFVFSDHLTAGGLVEYPKTPQAWSLELADCLRRLPVGAVVLGDHLLYGKAFDFFDWNRQRRCVDVFYPVSVPELHRLIRRYKVTHIVLTPFSGLTGLASHLCGNPARFERLATSSPSLSVHHVLGH